MEGRYEIEEQKQNEGQSKIKQKVGGEYRVTETTLIEGKKELKQKDAEDQGKNQAADD